MTYQWHPGQKAAINRAAVVTIDRVTASGIAVIGGKKFNPNGVERGGDGKLEPLTPELEDEKDRTAHGKTAGVAVSGAILSAERWARDVFGPWSRKIPTHADIEKAGRLIAAIKEVLK